MYNNDLRSIFDFIDMHSKTDYESVAFFCDAYSYTWGECVKTISVFADVFKREYNICARDFVLLECESTPDDVLVLLSLLSIGCHVSLQHSYKSQSVKIYTKEKVIEIFSRNKIQSVLLDNSISLSSLKSIDTRDSFVILYTSGSEAVPKGIVLSQFSFINNALNFSDCSDLKKSDKICLIPHIQHCFGLIVLFAGITIGAQIFFPSTSNCEKLLNMIYNHKLTMINTVPTVFLGMVQHPNFNSSVVESVRSGVIAGSAYERSLFQSIEKQFNMKLFSSYGLTEFCATVTFCTKDQDASLNVGKFIPGVYGIIKDSHNNIVLPYEEGEICLKGYNCMKGYWEDNQINPCPVDGEGWFHTGDKGYLDQDGFLYITGRIKEIIIRGGENISVSKLEKAAFQCEGVDECVVIAIEDTYYGEVPCMIIRANNQFCMTLLVHHLQLILKKHEVPKLIYCWDNIPKTENGKYDKEKIRNIVKRIRS